MQTYKLTWDTIDELVYDLYQKLLDKPPSIIIGISRGGLVPAVMLSHALAAPLYTFNPQCPNFYEMLNLISAWRGNVVFVDEINDSGQTLWNLSKRLEELESHPNIRWVSLIEKSTAIFKCSHFGWYLTPNDARHEMYAIFPWEVEEDNE